MNKNLQPKYDFFTEIPIVFHIKDKEYSVHLSLFGLLNTQNNQSFPTVSTFKISKVKYNNKEINCTEEISKYVVNWIENNQTKLKNYVSSDLSIFSLFSKIPKKPINSFDNLIDKR